MKIKEGQNYLITTHAWFVAPDGVQYRAVWGKIHSIQDSKESLGIETNSRSTNWYIVIGNMIIAGCQIFYAIQTDEVNFFPTDTQTEYQGKLDFHRNQHSYIYDANGVENG